MSFFIQIGKNITHEYLLLFVLEIGPARIWLDKLGVCVFVCVCLN